MAKKSKPNKKHQFKHGLPETARTGAPVSSVRSDVIETARNFDYVLNDVKRLALIAAGLFLLEIALWYVLSSTGVGKTIYGLIKL
jgi:hypothetical protein